MADIIPLDEKLETSREKKASLRRKQKALAVRRVVQCTSCNLKCEKCGTQVEPGAGCTQERCPHSRVPYRFCEACEEEYLDYIERLQGRGDPDCYWHNEEWTDAWRKWIDYQGSIDRYVKSKEFLRLIQEFKQP
ncbi:MAG: hypothetical protein MUF46_08265 [Desulfobacterales bacterium]|nr:hypothetical protein [Desulfobacterales bacterium]MCU0585239.1 hypothetical protein [Desulfobacterales bacterium]